MHEAASKLCFERKHEACLNGHRQVKFEQIQQADKYRTSQEQVSFQLMISSPIPRRTLRLTIVCSHCPAAARTSSQDMPASTNLPRTDPMAKSRSRPMSSNISEPPPKRRRLPRMLDQLQDGLPANEHSQPTSRGVFFQTPNGSSMHSRGLHVCCRKSTRKRLHSAHGHKD